MNKEAAAKRLGVSVRTLERLATQGRIGVTHKPGKRGVVADYGKEEVEGLRERLKAEKAEAVSYKPAVVESQSLTSPSSAAELTGLVAEQNKLLRHMAETQEEMLARLRNPAPLALPALQDSPNLANGPGVPLAEKLTLSLVEASQLSGLSRNHLRQAIEDKKLRARIIGRGWRVKRDDLDAYVKKL
jgi:excisionase family DNA binding protein